MVLGNYPYKSNGYASEPDANYDSDYVLKYHGADRKRTTSIGNQYEAKCVILIFYKIFTKIVLIYFLDMVPWSSL